MAKPPKPHRYRGRWRMMVTLKNGKRPAEVFDIYAEALAQLLDHYARHKTINKKGADAEFVRINHCLEGAGMPQLELGFTDKGGKQAIEKKPNRISSAWKAHNEARRAEHPETYKRIAALSKRRCSTLSITDFDGLEDLMTSEGYSPSTVQKEIALLKVAFGDAARVWGWKGFENPCIGIRLGKSERHFVYITDEQRDAIFKALSECDNPLMHTLVMVAKESTWRQGTLLNAKWSDIDVINKSSVLPTKTGATMHAFSPDVQAALANLPCHPSGLIFPMSANAVRMMWKRVRAKANVPDLQFRDLRHLGATDWVKRGMTAHEPMKVLGHKNIQTAQFYVDLVQGDMNKRLAELSKNGPTWGPPTTVFSTDRDGAISAKRSARMAEVTRKRMEKSAGTSTTDKPVESTAHAADAAGAALPRNVAIAAHHSAMEAQRNTLLEALKHAEAALRAVDPEFVAADRASNVIQFRQRQTG